MLKLNWLRGINLLQLFAEGGDGGDGGTAPGAAPGVDGVDPAHQRLLDLGVPESKIRKKKADSQLPAGAIRKAPAADQAEEQAASAKPSAEGRMTWDQIKADPEYQKNIEQMMHSRLKTAKGSEAALKALAPALELLAGNYGMDAENIDYGKLAEAVTGDGRYYEDAAIENGRSVEDQMEMTRMERESRMYRQQREMTARQEMFNAHMAKCEEQAAELQKVFPSFNLREEMKNDQFWRMIKPGGGFTVEDAFYAVHRKEIQAQQARVIQQNTARNLSRAIQSGSNRPAEAGTNAKAPSAAKFDYSKLSPAQRAEFKRQLREASARGEKIYPSDY